MIKELLGIASDQKKQWEEYKKGLNRELVEEEIALCERAKGKYEKISSDLDEVIEAWENVEKSKKTGRDLALKMRSEYSGKDDLFEDCPMIKALFDL